MCRRENVTLVHYIYGDELKQSAGQARSRVELPALATSVREAQVYVVEVCRGCGWNHLVEQFLIGRSTDDAVDLAASGGTSRPGRDRRAPSGPVPEVRGPPAGNGPPGRRSSDSSQSVGTR